MLYDRNTGKSENLSESVDKSATDLAWSSDSKTIYFLAEDAGLEKLYQVPGGGGEAHEAGCASILVVNKWDLREGERDAEAEYRLALQEKFKYLAYAPVAFVSALTGHRVMQLFRLIDAVVAERERRIPTPELNAVIQEAVTRRPPPAERGRPVRIRYATQVGIKPPTFLCFATAGGRLHFSYLRYLENCLREAYGFPGTPIRLVVRGRR
jgi:GTP-binding protein